MENPLRANHKIVCREYDDGTVHLEVVKVDLATRRVTCATIAHYRQDDSAPLTTAEWMLVGAAEHVAQTLGYQPQLPF